MKPTEKQIELIKNIEGIISSWKNTNDIDSPTHESDINEELRKIDLSDHCYTYLRRRLQEILYITQNLKP